ncbi:hypothetical protein D3C78_1246680 [compost metagenome]
MALLPSAVNMAMVAGSASTFCTTLLTASITSGGVPAGATSAFQSKASKPSNPDSATVGTSGRIDRRSRALTAKGRSTFPFSISCAACGVANM